MICQMCLRAEATIHVSDSARDGAPVESHYCRACFPIRSAGRPAGPPAFPLSRFTIKGLMIVAGLFAIFNAAIVLLMRSGEAPGAPAEIDGRTLRAVLFANIVFAVLAAGVVAILWLSRVRWFKMTGRWVPLTQPTQLKVERLLAGRAGMPTGRWMGASRGERFFFVSEVLWIWLCLFWLTPGRIRAWFPGFDLELILAWFLLAAGGTVLLHLGVVASTRRR